MTAFLTTDPASNLKDLDLDSEKKPFELSLGLIWYVNSNEFELLSDEKPVTRRGIISTIKRVFDPLGFLSFVIMNRKLLLRDIVSDTC